MEKEAKFKKLLVADEGEGSRVLVAKLNEKVAELERSEEELCYMSSVLGAIRNINELIVRERDKTKLLQDACRILQKVREYRFVWIGLIEEGHKRVIPMAMTGVESGYLDAVKITWDNLPSGRGPTGTAIKTRKPDMVKNIPENPRTVTWREEALKRGYRSSASIPLIHGEKVYGALNVYSSQPDGFSDAEIQLLVEVSGDLAFALKSIEEEEKGQQAEEALQAEKNKLKSVIDALEDGLTIQDRDYNIIYQNDLLKGMFGDRLGEKCYRVYEGKEELCPGCPVKKAFKDGKSHTSERKVVLPSEGVTFWENTANPIRDARGELVSCLEVNRNITERKRSEEALRESEEKYRELAESITDVFFAFDKNLRYTYWNKASEELTGIPAEDALGKHLLDIFPALDMTQSAGKMYLKALRTQKVQSFVNEYQLGGRNYFFEISAYPSKDGLSVFVKDVTDRKQAEAALKESEEKYKTLVEATSDIIWEVDTEGRFTFVSPKIKDLLGYEVDEVVGKKRPLDLIAKEEFSKWLKRFKQINAKRKPFSGLEVAHLHKNGRRVIFENSGIPLCDSAGEFKGYVGINRDITERRHMQEQLAITDRLASVGELAAGIAHELNNPLTGVIGFSQLLLGKEMPEDIKQDLQTVYSEAQRASQVVNNLLTFARRHPAVKQMLNINDVISKVLELRAYEQRVENIEVESLFEPGLPEIMADYFQLQQVFLNIIINAEYFMIEAQGRGKLTLTTERVGGVIRASFADDGPGINKDDLRHIFDPFFTTKEVGKGTGLGLSICHGIIAEHGGRIYVESELGKGTTFIVELPISAPAGK